MFGQNDNSNNLLADDNGLLQLGLSLLAAGGPSTQPVSLGQAFAGAVGQMQAAQRMRDEEELKRKQFGLAERQAALGERRFGLEEQGFQAQQEQALRAQQLAEEKRAALAQIVGQAPGVPNNFQGTGILGGQISPEEANKQIAYSLLQSGDDKGIALLGDVNRQFAPSEIGKQIVLEGLDPKTPEGQARARELADSRNQSLLNQQRAELQRGTNEQRGELGVINAADKTKLLGFQAAGDASIQVLDILPDAEKYARNISNLNTGPVLGQQAYLHPEGQLLQQAVASITLPLRSISGGMPGSLSNSDLEFLQKIAGSEKMDKAALIEGFSNLRKKLEIAKQRADFYNNKYYEKRTFRGAEDEFQKSLGPRATQKMPDSKSLLAPEVPASGGLSLLSSQPTKVLDASSW